MDVLDFPIERTGPPAGRDAAGGGSGPVGRCRHERLAIGPLVADVCHEAGTVDWSEGDDPVDPAAAVARLFGDFDLRAAAPALHAPGSVVIVCTPATRTGGRTLEAVPSDRWLEAMPSLWMRAAGRSLLLSATDPLLSGRLLRRLGAAVSP